MMLRASAVSWASVSLLLGCGGTGASTPSPPPPAPPTAETNRAAGEVFRMRCAPCHGKTGKGDGPSAAALKPKPRDFSLESWQRSISDAQIERAILEGGIALGLSPVMPAHPDLRGRPHVVTALRRMIRGFVKQPPPPAPPRPISQPTTQPSSQPSSQPSP